MFRESGTYKVTFLDAGYQELAAIYITITNNAIKAEPVNNAVVNITSNIMMEREDQKCVKCEGIKVHICQNVVEEKPVNEAVVFVVPEADPYVYILIENIVEFNSSHLVIDLYKTDGGKSTYLKRVECPIENGKEVAYLKYAFPAPGNYNLIVYNSALEPIGYKGVAIHYQNPAFQTLK